MGDNRILTQDEIQALVDDGGLPQEDDGDSWKSSEGKKETTINVPGNEPYDSFTLKSEGSGEELRSQPETNLDLVLDMPLEVSVILGSRKINIKSLLDVSPGSLLELQKKIGEPVEIYTNGKLLARGEIVSMDENFGVRIIEIVKPIDRINNLRNE